MKRTIASLAVIAGLLLAGSAPAATWPPKCHAVFQLAPRPDPVITNAVSVTDRGGLSCSAALHIAAKAEALPGIKIERGPWFIGGWGGPFHVGSFHCYLINRLSDTKIGICWRNAQFVSYTTHHQSGSYYDRGFHPTALKP
jgi:hypothetical protein